MRFISSVAILTELLGLSSGASFDFSIKDQFPILGTDKPVARRSNVVFILTDDQDLHLNSLDYMPHVQRHLIDQGTFYKRHFTTTAVCCPARVSILTGKAPHNTNVTDLTPPYGR
jgi:arylsulfatase A-like enzyme